MLDLKTQNSELVTALGRSPNRTDRLQAGFDLGAVGLEEGRQRESLAEVRRVLVGGEAGAVGGDLEEDAARLAEVERLEVVAVDDVGDADARPPAPVAPGPCSLSSGARNATWWTPPMPRLRGWQVGPLLDADLRAGAAGTGLEDDGARAGVVRRGIVAGLPEVRARRSAPARSARGGRRPG